MVPITRVAVLLMLATGYGRLPATAQGTREPVCDQPNGDMLACALHAGRIADLRSSTFGRNEREVRFWTHRDMFEPIELLVIHQRGEVVTGRTLLIWSDSTLTDSIAVDFCTTEMWRTPAGSLCVAKPPATPDWARVLRRLDAQGLAQLPARPVPEWPCATRPGSGSLTGCRFVDHGTSWAIEVRTSGVYWRYDFPRVPDDKAAGYSRDLAILQTLKCASQWARCADKTP